jgi:hypothetical protein
MLVKLSRTIVPTLLISAVFFLSQNAFPQNQNASGLRGVKKIFIDTRQMDKGGRNGDAHVDEQIAKEIKEKLPELEIVDAPNGAKIHLRFKVKGQNVETADDPPEMRRVPGKTIHIGSGGIATGGRALVCIGIIFEILPDDTLVLSESEYWMNSPFDKKPWKKFADAFVKAYKKAN